MKKVLVLMLAVLMAVSLLAACGGDSGKKEEPGKDTPQSSGKESSADYFEWDIADETVIVGYTEKGLKQTSLVIPANCTEVSSLHGNTKVEHIEFANPDTVVKDYTFKECPALESVILPANLQTVGKSMFADCVNLKKVEIPAGVTKINDNAFARCTALEEVTLGGAVEEIGRDVFESCTALKSIALPDSLVLIEESAFEGCSALETVTFGSGLKTVEESAFEACVSLKSVDLQEGVTELGKYAFGFCDALETVSLPASLETVDQTALAQTHNFTVYVVEGSFMDTYLPDMMGEEYMTREYK